MMDDSRPFDYTSAVFTVSMAYGLTTSGVRQDGLV
jgi:hypothetical protein